MQGFEVGVIGAGIHGASVAYHLSSRGVRTLIEERAAPAGSPTRRSSAMPRLLHESFPGGRCPRHIEIFRHFKEITGGREAGFQATGGLFTVPKTSRR